jgi:hypothetical protein
MATPWNLTWAHIGNHVLPRLPVSGQRHIDLGHIGDPAQRRCFPGEDRLGSDASSSAWPSLLNRIRWNIFWTLGITRSTSRCSRQTPERATDSHFISTTRAHGSMTKPGCSAAAWGCASREPRDTRGRKSWTTTDSTMDSIWYTLVVRHSQAARSRMKVDSQAAILSVLLSVLGSERRVFCRQH